jgi:ribosomal peptide maturation radical SAM protein 1
MTAPPFPRDEGSPAEVCLVNMPYAGLTRPSMALGLLKGILMRDGIRTVVANAHVWFAERTGLELYALGSGPGPTDLLIGEWTFAQAAFPGHRERDEEYLAGVVGLLVRRGHLLARRDERDGDALLADLRALRQQATEFIDAAARRILDTGARVVGCTSTFEQHVASLALLRRIRELDPGVVTMMGGANCETTMGEATHRSFPWVDYVASGEADGVITPLCRLALSKGRDVTPAELPRGVLGPCHRQDHSHHQHHGAAKAPALPRALYRDLDSLPDADFGDYFAEIAASTLHRNILPALPLETSRGCWWGASHQCTFCGLNGSSLGYRSKSADRVLAEIHHLEERYGISKFEVVDNILDMKYFNTLLPTLAAEPGKRTFFYEVKANLTRQQVEALVAAGITWVQPGIESLHTEVLRLMDKGVRGWQNVQLLKWARELGLRLSWGLLCGFPGEKDEYYQQMARWIPLLEHLQPPSGLYPLRYDRYSVYHQQAQKMGLLLMPIPSMSYVYPLGDADLNDLAYFFTSSPQRSLVAAASTPAFTRTGRPGLWAVQDAVRQWQEAYNVTPRPVLSLSDRDGVAEIIDTRGTAEVSRRRLTGLSRAVLLACGASPPAARLAEILERDHGLRVSAAELDETVGQLVADRLVLPIDGRLMGLAVRGALPDPPNLTSFPGGFLIMSSPGRARPRPEQAGEPAPAPIAAGAP